MKKDKDILELLEKAKISLEAAENLVKSKFYDFSVSRSYYAMFYTPASAKHLGNPHSIRV